MSSHNNTVNPYTSPSESAELFSTGFDAKLRILPQWVSIVWDATLFVIFGFYVPSMVRATARLFTHQSLDMQTVSKLPERWMLAFVLLSLTAYFGVQRHVLLRVVYGVVVISFLFQHSPVVGFGDLITAAIAAAVFLPVFTHGFGWSGVARSIFVWVARSRRVLNACPQHLT